MPSICRQRWLGFLLAITYEYRDVHSFQIHSSTLIPKTPPLVRLHASSSSDETNINDDDKPQQTEKVFIDSEDGSIAESKVTIDDGGSDLNDRFKYKVHALMGTYDPPTGTVDDENQTGNIIGSMLQFPTEYTFTAVGKTGDENAEAAADVYASEVKTALASILGNDAKMELRVVPRGKKFTRVTAKVTVESGSIISSIYENLEAIECTVMKF